jgi:hypothetical protein
MAGEWRIPENHPIDTEAKAREITALIAEPCRQFIASCCVPVFWWAADQPDRKVLHNGTITLVKTSARVIGLTADHVVTGCLEAFEGGGVCVQIADASAHDLRARVIARSEELDIATLDMDGLMERLGWPDKRPLESWPPIPPQEGRGIMIGGYPGIEREVIGPGEMSFGLFTALVVARTVSDDQISCLFEREYMMDSEVAPTPPPNTELGGISGGPVITVCESASHLVSFRLGGIVSEAHSGLEKVFAKRADLIREDGRF